MPLINADRKASELFKTAILLIVIFSFNLYPQYSSLRVVSPPTGCTAVSDHPTEKNTLIAGTGNNGFFKSTDEGKTWSVLSDNYNVTTSKSVFSTAIGKIIFDPDDPNILYARTGFEETGSGIGMLRSTDGGKTWETMNNGLLYSQWISDLNINPWNHNEFYAVSISGLYKSTNRGVNWTKTDFQDVTGPIVFSKTDSLSFTYFNTEGTIFETFDGGKTFNKYPCKLNRSFRIYNSCIDTLSGFIYIVTGSGLYKVYFKRSIAPLEEKFPVIDTVFKQSGEIITRLSKVECSPKTGTVFVSTVFGLYRSSTHGKSWKLVLADSGNVNYWTRNKSVTFINNKVLAFTRDGLFASEDDGLTWKYVSDGPPNAGIKKLVIHPANNRLWGTVTESGIYLSSDKGNSWKRIKNPMISDANCFEFQPDNQRIFYTGYDKSFYNKFGLYKTTDSGINWTDISPNATTTVTDIAIHPGKPETIFMGATNGLWKSSNGGKNWELKLAKDIGSITISPAKPQYLYSWINYSLPTERGIYASEDSGKTWIKRTTGKPLNSYVFNPANFVSNPLNPAELYCSANANIYKTNDFAFNWSPINTLEKAGNYGNEITGLFIKPGAKDIVFASLAGSEQNNYSGLYYSSTPELAFDKFKFDKINNQSLSIIRSYLDGSEYHLVCGTLGGGIIDFIPEPLTSVNKSSSSNSPANLHLSNYPNPFNLSTTISFQVPKPGRVKIEIYNIIGRKVSTIADRYFDSGQKHTVEYNAADMTSGMYFCRMTFENRTEVRKIILMK